MDETRDIAVVGAGIVGLTTANLLQDALPNAHVTIIADKFLTETTSDGAAGLYRPSLNFGGPSEKLTEKWLKDSYKFYDEMLEKHTPEYALSAGFVRRRIYYVSTKSPDLVRNSFLEKILEDYRFLSEKELRTLFQNDRYKYGATYTTLLVECRKYLPYLTRRFQDKGGKIISRKLKNFEELTDKYNLVFNCTGLGSKELLGDNKLIPMRGQVFKVRAPWVQSAVYMDSDTYIIPGTDGVVTLGGTRQFNSTNEQIDKHDAAGIWERCTSVLPSLKNAKIEQEWVGFRPHRSEVRVEKEIMIFPNGKSLKVIHNYGHGGFGVLSAPGTSMHAVSLGIQALREGKRSKL